MTTQDTTTLRPVSALPDEEVEEIRYLIIRALAHYKKPSDVEHIIAEECGVSISRQAISRYSPEYYCHPKQRPNKKYLKLFRRLRAKYLDDRDRIPIANAAWRLEQLGDLYEQAKGKKLIGLAKDVLMDADKIASPQGRGPRAVAEVDVPGEDGPVQIRLKLFDDVTPPPSTPSGEAEEEGGEEG